MRVLAHRTKELYSFLGWLVVFALVSFARGQLTIMKAAPTPTLIDSNDAKPVELG